MNCLQNAVAVIGLTCQAVGIVQIRGRETTAAKHSDDNSMTDDESGSAWGMMLVPSVIHVFFLNAMSMCLQWRMRRMNDVN